MKNDLDGSHAWLVTIDNLNAVTQCLGTGGVLVAIVVARTATEASRAAEMYGNVRKIESANVGRVIMAPRGKS